MAGLRIDLDGIPLDDEDGRTTAILRYRTTRGVVLQLPESVEVTVPWGDLDLAEVDLKSGRVMLRIAERACPTHRWLGAARTLAGRWTDRAELEAPPTRRA
jgi:hypothetical protein